MENLTPDRMATLFDQFPLGLVLAERSGDVFFTNEALTGMTGAEGFELIGQGFYDLLFPSPEVNARVRQKTLSALENAFDDLDLTLLRGPEDKVTLHFSGGIVGDGKLEFIVLVVQDVTSKKAFEKVIESSFDNFIQVTNALDAATKKLNEQNAILENYKDKMTKELDIAKSVQKAIIPTRFPELPGFEMAGVSIPSEELGGDYFDYFLLDKNHIGILIADVSGHGVPSSLITTMVKAYFEYYTKRFLEPDAVLTNVNRDMAAIITDTGFYLTALYAVLNLPTREISVSVAGHDSALCWNSVTGAVQRLGDGCDGTILGVFPDATYTSKSYRLEPSSKIVMFTDGITEARSDTGEFFGNLRLETFLRGQTGRRSAETVQQLIDEVNAFYGSSLPNDDRTLVVFDLLGESGSRPAIESENPVDLVALARQKFTVRDFNGTLEALSGNLGPVPRTAARFLLAGQACAHLGRDEEASTHLAQAVRLDPNSPQGWYFLGLVRHNLGRREGARDAWQQAFALQPDYRDLRSLLARPQDPTP